MDIQVLISKRRVGADENIDTKAAAESLVANLIPVYNSSDAADCVNGFYHNKYWIIDGKHVFVYSGNWSPRSVSEQQASYSSGDVNRDMGIGVLDATNVASYYKNVWDQDVAVGSAWELPIGIKQTSFSDADVISGAVTVAAQSSGLDNSSFSYRWDNMAFVPITATVGVFSVQYETTQLDNGINTLEVKADTGTMVFTDKVTVNVVNIGAADNWRVLITEVLPNPSEVDDTLGEFFELTNTFPFAIALDGWKIGDDKAFYTFAKASTIPEYTSLLVGRSETGFSGAYGFAADIILGFSLTNSADYIQLKNAKGEYVDVVAWGMAAPDGSEQLEAPGAGESLQRSPLYRDTNTAADFTTGAPEPKGNIPHTPLGVAAGEESSFSWTFIIAPVVLAILKKRK